MPKENSNNEMNSDKNYGSKSKRRKRDISCLPFGELPKDLNVSNTSSDLKSVSRYNVMTEEFYNGINKICVNVDTSEIKGTSTIESIRNPNISFFENLSSLEWVKESAKIPPLMKPLLLGWQRKTSQLNVTYISPVGEVFKTISQLFRYLISNENTHLQIDLFSFDLNFHIYSKRQFINNNAKFFSFDYSTNKEIIPISCINTINKMGPQKIHYITERVPSKGVHILDDNDFLICCDCKDGCSDRKSCACQQLTINSACHSKRSNRSVGYTFKRLKKAVATGIYECNDKCQCKSSCLNRVVQNGMISRLQIFKTDTKGWGVRCLDNIPKGTFITTYVGEIKTEAEADNDAKSLKHGDTYFFELDFIETAENLKEQLYSKQDNSELSSSDSDLASDYDSDLEIDKNEILTFEMYKKKEERKQVRLLQSENSYRQWFNNEVFIIDSQNTGNISRFFNHSCKPNMFVQTVFTNSHDIRFPQLAFFTNKNIKRGEELTFDYAYQPGTIPNRHMLCTCGQKECRKRIL